MAAIGFKKVVVVVLYGRYFGDLKGGIGFRGGGCDVYALDNI